MHTISLRNQMRNESSTASDLIFLSLLYFQSKCDSVKKRLSSYDDKLMLLTSERHTAHRHKDIHLENTALDKRYRYAPRVQYMYICTTQYALYILSFLIQVL